MIGAGISGLAAAYYLSRKHDVFLFEREERLGGHTNTVMVESSRGPLAVDTGFIVHNDRTYPNFIQLMSELGVPRTASDMSFAVSCRQTGYEYSSRGLRGYFAQTGSVFSARPYRLFRELRRFNREAPKIFDRADEQRLKLGEFLDECKYSEEFRQYYLYPMAAAVWSCAPGTLREFPAAMLIRFFDNHGMLTINGHPKWKTIPGGCSRYIEPMTAPYRERIALGAKIRGVRRDEGGVTISFSDGRAERRYDHVVFATNGDRVLTLLEDASEHERDVLGKFQTSRNEVVLHTDDRLLPRRPEARASWNYLLNADDQDGDRRSKARPGRDAATMTYHMNRLQSLAVKENYCITLNASEQIRPERVLRKFVYHHPLFTLGAMRAQEQWGEISGARRTHFCGAYWRYGFHEDGVVSALRVARALGVAV